MSRRHTAIGAMYRRDRAEGVRELLATIERLDGNLSRAAHDLDIGRRHIYKLIWRDDLWGEVNAIRDKVEHRKKVGPGGWIEKTRAALRAGRRTRSRDGVRTA